MPPQLYSDKPNCENRLFRLTSVKNVNFDSALVQCARSWLATVRSSPLGSRDWYSKAMREQEPALKQLELTSPEALERFRRAAKAFTTRAVKSKAAAREVLIKEGIYTKSGKLTKQYR